MASGTTHESSGGRTREPAGPLPPQPVQSLQRISHRLTVAIAHVLEQEGVSLGHVLTHVPPYWRTSRNFTLRLDYMTRSEHDRPNVMDCAETAETAQIDFIMVRSQHVTARSKQANVIAEFPVAGWRGGPRHFPAG